jgi:MT0933-like antitoxin protein
MSFLDKAKHALGQAKGRAGRLADQHGDKVHQAIDKGGSYLDQRTSGKYSDKIHKAGDSAKGAATRLADQYGEGEQTASSPKLPEEPTSRMYPPQPVDPAEPIDRPDPLAPDSNRENPNRP